MGKETGISWVQHTFNAVWGCTKWSPGCAHCYAETFSKRYKWDIWGPGKPRRTFGDKHWNEPLHWNAAAKAKGVMETCFSGSMCDWCDREWPAGVRERLFDLIRKTKNLFWLLLTKRPENIEEFLPDDWSAANYSNVALGVSIESNPYVTRAKIVTKTEAAVHFVSAEPLLGPLPDLDLTDIEWVIVGGESGAGWRKMEEEWATDLRDRCLAQKVKFFYKQGNGMFSGNNPYLQGKEWKQRPRLFSLPVV